MTNFIIYFLIGAIVGFIVRVAKQVQKRRDEEIIINGDGNNVKYEYTRGNNNDKL